MEATRSRNEGHMAPFSLMDWAALRPWSRVSRSAHSASASSGAEDGDTAAFAAMSNWPWELDGALAERLLETGGHIAIYGHFIPAGTRLLTPELAGQVTYDSNFYGVERGLEPMATSITPPPT